MRYGRPSVAAGLAAMARHGVRRLLVLPMYPQYSATTTASVFDAVGQALRGHRWIPELRFVNGYADHPGYIDALADSVREYWQGHGRGQKLLFSFHGVPRRYLLQGDPYHCQCHKTARLVASELELDEDQWQVVFQSRFGREEWLKPYADHTLRSLPGQGVKRVDELCPGFAADCLETLEEMAMLNRQLYLDAGGEDYQYIPALNARTDHIDSLADLVRRHAAGWPEFDRGAPAAVDADPGGRQARALALGAPC